MLLSMLPGLLTPGGEVPVAHPETPYPHVAVPVALVALGAVLVVVVVAASVPARAVATASDDAASLGTTSWAGSLTAPQQLVRGLVLAGLVLVMVAGRLGADDELENLAPALAVGAGWPLLVAGCLLIGTLWRWADPWDTVTRVVLPRDASTPPEHVWPAVGVAVPLLWYLGAYARPLDPRSVGLAVAVYSVVTVAGCIAVGRARWLGSAEPIGLLLSWVGLIPRRRLKDWAPPPGAAALLGAVFGGLLFGSVRRTGLWAGMAASPDESLYAAAGLVAACMAGAASGQLASRAGRSPAQRAVAVQVLVPVVAGIALAVALTRNRLFTSVQLLPGLLGDPLGRGWDLLGSPTSGLDPAPLGAAGLVAAQLFLVAIMHVLAAATAPRTLVGDERLPVIAVLATSVAVSMTVIGLH